MVYEAQPPTRRPQRTPRLRWQCVRALVGAGRLRCDVDPPHRLPEGVTSFGIGYGTFVLDHNPIRGFLDAEVQWTRNPSDAAVRRWSPSTAWKKLASKRDACDKAPVWQQFHASRSLQVDPALPFIGNTLNQEACE